MRWRRDRFPEYVPRPKARRLTEKEKNKLLAVTTRAVAASPVLSYLGIQVRALRGRFYIERESSQDEVADVMGRITPLLGAKDALLLEVQGRSGIWREVAQGSPAKLIKVIASDTKGRFHGLGSVDKVLRKSGKGMNRLPVKMKGKCQFVYAETGADCTAQEALFHYFGLPLEVIAEPAVWYSYHRTPRIVEFSKDRTRVLVRFTAESLSGTFGGTCLYAQRDEKWAAYRIRPSESRDIASADA
jgi:hypothetical protein